MHAYRLLRLGLIVTALILTAGCATPAKYDYSTYRAHLPRSVLVLPPLSQSTDIKASYSYLSTVSRPLAESGYYVFPVAVVDAFMKENGLPTPGDMHAIPLDKIGEVFGADAVLYITVEEYGQKYRLLTSTTTVKAKAALVDVATGTTLWEGTTKVAQSSGDSGAGIIGALVTAVASQIVSSTTDHAHTVSATVNHQMFFNKDSGLLLGPYHPNFEADLRGR
jgi:hypothetical protein